MVENTLTNDLSNCIINFDRKVLVTNLLDKYGGLLEETAKTVQKFLASEEEKGKQFEKIFLLRGRQAETEDEIITLIPENKLEQRKEKLRDVHSMLYSAEAAGGSKSPPTEFVPLKHISIKLNSLEVKESPAFVPPSNGTVPVKEEKPAAKKPAGSLGAMFKKQETTAAVKKSPQKSPPKKAEPEKKATGALGAMFKKQEATATKKSIKTEAEKKPNALGAMFKKQESKTSPEKKHTVKSTPEENKSTSKKGLTSFLTKKEDETPKKSSSTTTTNKNKNKSKEEPPVNVSVNLFEESESSDDEEALDALKRQVLTDDEEDKPSTSNKRRRIIDSDDEDTGPEVKVERKEEEPMDTIEVEEEEPKQSQTYLDDDGFIVTVKSKNKKPAATKKPAPTPIKVKKESPKSPVKKEAPSKAAAAKKKQGNIMSFFTKK